MDVRVRKIRFDEIDLVVELRRQMLSELSANQQSKEFWDNTRRYMEKHYEDGTLLCYLAEADGKVVSTGLLCIYEYLPRFVNVTGTCGYVNNVFTLPEYRGKGISQKLLEEMLGEAKAMGVNEVYLHAEESAIPLYKRVGFDLCTLDMVLQNTPCQH